jgi:TRAP-type mannitol/chloroaromatic compound transport system substrate-binding protein
MEYQNQKALQELRKKSNVEVLQFPAAVLAELRTLTEATLTDEAEANPEFKRIYEAYTAFSKSYSDWSAMSDEAYQLSLMK